MKTIFTFLLVAMVTIAFSQTIYRVNNKPGVTGTNIYATIQAAHDAATNGDMIYVEPSGVTHGALVCTKDLTIVGPGYFMTQNFPNSPSTSGAILDDIEFNTGSEGSAIYGCDPGKIYIRVSNITVSQNVSIGNISIGPLTAVDITGIVITKNFGTGVINSTGTGSFQVNISNNFLNGDTFGTNNLSLSQSNSSGIFSNNIFYSVIGGISLQNFNITNNIVQAGTQCYFTSCTTTNNIDCVGSAFGTSDGNQGSIGVVNVFVSTDFMAAYPPADAGAMLKAASPAIGAGVAGADCGIFGGADPYLLSGIPPYPQITKLIGTTTGNTTTPLSITISTKSN